LFIPKEEAQMLLGKVSDMMLEEFGEDGCTMQGAVPAYDRDAGAVAIDYTISNESAWSSWQHKKFRITVTPL